MRVFKSTTVCSNSVHRANPLSICHPVALRALSSTRGQYVGSYDTVTRTHKSEETHKIQEDSSVRPGGSRLKGENELASSSTDGKVDKNVRRNGVKALQKPAEEAKMDEEEREYQAEVEQHNKEFAEGHDRAADHATDMKVDEKFWKGEHQHFRCSQ
jgi:hypothetical protein